MTNLIQPAAKIVSLLDLTRLSEDDSEKTIAVLCEKALAEKVAAVCLYPKFVPQAKALLKNSSIKIATVANFPNGDDSVSDIITSIESSLKEGADEIDVVLPYKRFMAGDRAYPSEFIRECKDTCGKKIILKVILETGALEIDECIEEASRLSLLAGADFIKTSTGKITTGATLHAASIMLKTIQRLSEETQRSYGFKASGGVRTFVQAQEYINLAEKIMGADWVSADTLRIGASQLS